MSQESAAARLVQRFEAAADEFPEFTAVVWCGCRLVPPSENGFTPRRPPIFLARGVRVDELHSFGFTLDKGCDWGWELVTPDDLVASSRRMITLFEMLVRQATGGWAEQKGYPNNRVGCLLAKIADQSGNKTACPPWDGSGWMPHRPAFWRVAKSEKYPEGVPMPDWWCVSLPHAFQHVASFLQDLRHEDLDQADEPVGPKFLRWGGNLHVVGPLNYQTLCYFWDRDQASIRSMVAKGGPWAGSGTVVEHTYTTRMHKFRSCLPNDFPWELDFDKQGRVVRKVRRPSAG